MSTSEHSPQDTETTIPNFVRDRVRADIEAGATLHTRFPPEPNGYLHIGHAKSICLNFGLANDLGGLCNLRFDDTNPVAEDQEFVDSIQDDVRWLGFDWQERLYFASDYFERLFACAVQLIEAGKAYVDSLSLDEIREYRGNFYTPGKASPYRERSVDENLELFKQMRAGVFADGAHVLRAKIDMASPNLNMRDPLLYRIRHVHHHRTGDAWPIYPMYDFAHGLCDAFENISHSICTLEFEAHRPLYEWLLEALNFEQQPQQIEFARLNLSYTVLSKRKLKQLVTENHVEGWDDPRMPTLVGMRRRGIPPQAIRDFCERIGVSKRDGVVDVTLFEHAIRSTLEHSSKRMMAVLKPLKVVIENIGETERIELEAPFHPEITEFGSRTLHLTREIWIEQDDFMEEPMKKWFRLAPGKEVRLRYACLLTCERVIHDAQGNVIELRCTWDPESKGGRSPDGRKVKGTLHWISTLDACNATVKLYDRLFTSEAPGHGHEGENTYLRDLNPDSLAIHHEAKLEASILALPAGETVQWERLGYFTRDTNTEAPVFLRTIALKDSWAKLQKKQTGA